MLVQPFRQLLALLAAGLAAVTRLSTSYRKKLALRQELRLLPVVAQRLLKRLNWNGLIR